MVTEIMAFYQRAIKKPINTLCQQLCFRAMFPNRSGTTDPLKSLINSVNLSLKLSQLADPLGAIYAGI